MSSGTRRIWEVYFAFAAAITAGRAYSFFMPQTPEHLYFHILYSFNPVFSISYILALLQIISSAFQCLPLALYILERRLGPRLFWQIVFILRVILDATGNSYAKNILVSLYRNDLWVCVLTLLYLALPYAPWYWACSRYAFTKDFD